MSTNNEYLQHHGVLGMKWGVRKAQNKANVALKRASGAATSDRRKMFYDDYLKKQAEADKKKSELNKYRQQQKLEKIEKTQEKAIEKKERARARIKNLAKIGIAVTALYLAKRYASAKEGRATEIGKNAFDDMMRNSKRARGVKVRDLDPVAAYGFAKETSNILMLPFNPDVKTKVTLK